MTDTQRNRRTFTKMSTNYFQGVGLWGRILLSSVCLYLFLQFPKQTNKQTKTPLCVFNNFKKKWRDFPGSPGVITDSMLPLQGAWVRSLVRELGSCKSGGMAKKKKKEKKKRENNRPKLSPLSARFSQRELLATLPLPKGLCGLGRQRTSQGQGHRANTKP